MTDDLASTVEDVLERVDAAYEEYDQGYADADATLRVVDDCLDDLRAAVED
jgi:hypothetical protein